MLWLLDTNILISAALFPESLPARAFTKAVSWPHHAVVCEYSMDEMRRVYNRKFPDRIQVFERFVSLLALSVEIVPLANDEIFDVEMAQKSGTEKICQYLWPRVQQMLKA